MNKAEVVQLLEYGRRVHQTFMQALTVEEQNAIGTLQQWAAKDTLAHLLFWQERLEQRLTAMYQGQTVEPFNGTLDEVNDAVFYEYQGRAWDDLVETWDAVYSGLSVRVLAFKEEDLLAAGLFEEARGNSVVGIVVGGVLLHPVLHFADYCAQRGNLERGVVFHADLCAHLGQIESLPFQGLSLYNFACFYALNNHPAEAVRRLAEGLALAPFMRENARQDPDFVSLHNDPDFVALVQEA
jgi:hypothetical protein